MPPHDMPACTTPSDRAGAVVSHALTHIVP